MSIKYGIERNPGYYWVHGLTWGNPSWFITQWRGNMFWSDGDDYSEDCFIEINKNIILRDCDREFYFNLEIIDLLNSKTVNYLLFFESKINENDFRRILASEIPIITKKFLSEKSSNDFMTDKKMVELLIEHINSFKIPINYSCVLSENKNSDADYNMYPEIIEESSELPISPKLQNGFVHQLSFKRKYFSNDFEPLFFLSEHQNWNSDYSVFKDIKSDMFLSEISKIFTNRGFKELTYKSFKMNINSNDFSDFWKEFLDDDLFLNLKSL